LVIVPISADQPDNSARCAALGVGRVVEAGDVTPQAIRDAVRTVLGDPAYYRNAWRVRGEILRLPEPGQAVRLLEQLAAGRCSGAVATA
jgi:UDP:flavonoid glycosyltransferase YjiC (YdhE family)